MTQTLPFSGRALHFIGIGGAGMSGLAQVAKQLGASVTGSDRADDSEYRHVLAEHGITATVGHGEANVPPAADVVYSSAIDENNPELQIAKRRKQRLMHRADFLAELTQLKPTIAVSGTHGKSTVSSMIVHALTECGLDPAFLVGAEVRSRNTNAAWGKGEWLVVEADESDRSLLKLFPTIGVVTNLELDHHTTYSSVSDVADTFQQFLEKAHTAVIWDRPELQKIARTLTEIHSFDVTDFQANESGSTFSFDGISVELSVPGLYNAVNAAAALTVCKEVGADLRTAANALATFTGASRRFEFLGRTHNGARFVSDYAHHPTEVRATLEAARSVVGPDAEVIAVFQPHLYSRTKHEVREFGRALALADQAIVTDIYPARERAEDYPGVTGLMVAEATIDARPGMPVAWVPDFASLERFVARQLGHDDLCIFLGAGSIDAFARRFARSATTATTATTTTPGSTTTTAGEQAELQRAAR